MQSIPSRLRRMLPTFISSGNSTSPVRSIAGQLWTIGSTDSRNRTGVTELSGCAVSYAYDNIYRLTSETIASDPSGNNGAVNYTYDAVGNRTQMNSMLAAVPSGGHAPFVS